MIRAAVGVTLMATSPCALGTGQVHADYQLSCREPAELEREVESIAGRSFDELTAEWTEIAVRIEAAGERGFELTVVMVSRDGTSSERQVLADSCEEAAGTAAVVLATSLAGAVPEPEEVTPPPEPPAIETPLPVSPKEANPKPETPPEPAPAPAKPESGTSLDLALGARLGVDLGTLEEPWPLAELCFSLRSDHLGARLSASSTSPSEVTLTQSGGAANVALIKVGASGAYRWWGDPLAVWTYAGLELGSIRAEGDQVRNRRADAGLWSAALLGVEVAWPLGAGLGLTFGVEGALPSRKFDIVLTSGEGYRTGPLSLRPSVGLEIDLWR